MLPIQAGEIHLSLGTMTVFTVQPGQLWDRQLGTLPRKGNKAYLAVAEIKVIELAQEEIANAVGFQSLLAIATAQRRIGLELELPEGEIAKLPAQMQQALPDIQRQRYAFNFQMAAVFQAGIDIPRIERWTEVLPARTDLTYVHRHAGGGFDFRQHLRAPAIQMRQNEA